MAPCEVDLFLREEMEQHKERLYAAALICSTLANINRDEERHPEPYTPQHFMPGAKTEEDEMREFVEAVQRGDTFEVDPDEVEAFKRQMEATFGKRGDQGNLVTTEPRRGLL